ncbi:MAG: leucyl aminopeptidase [Pirellulales bacterium]|nr:leucyl aminopeptidase [Pirellulales bacterium]
MKIDTLDSSVVEAEADALVVPVFAGAPLSGSAATLDRAAGGLIERLIGTGEFGAKPYETLTLHSPAGVRAPLVLLVGLGKREEWNQGLAFRAAAAAARALATKRRRSIAYFLEVDAEGERFAAAGIAGVITGCVGQDLYRAEKKLFPFGELHWAGADEAALDEGRILGEAINLARRLVNEPPDVLYPATFAERAVELSAEHGLECEVWDEKLLADERMFSLLGVARGSANPPRMVLLRYRGAPEAPLVALVGKGVTFDSGGLSLKPSDSMQTMKCDMAGAATVLAAMTAIARLGLRVNVIGMLGLVENMPGGNSFKLGDVLTARNGRTIEVLNTDAEGRLVLADVLSIAIELGATRIVDLATLTGACMVALGPRVAGLMTNDQPWCDDLLAAAAASGEPCWQLPMFADYGDMIRSEVADIKNIGEGRWGGAITAAKFLEEFVSGKPWTHCDIAGPAFAEKPSKWADAGGTGYFVRTLVELARRLEDSNANAPAPR